MKYLIQILLIIFISGCSESLEEQTFQLVNAKNKWLKIEKNQSYSFNYKRNCFCAFNGKDIVIKVQDGKVISAKSDGKEIPPKSFLTIKGYFKRILELLKRQEREGDLKVAIEYDPRNGFPTKIVIKSSVIDVSSTEYLSNLKLP